MWIITKLKFKSDILKSSNKSILYKFLNNLFIFFFINVKTRERLQKRAHETHQNLSEEEKSKQQYGREPYKNLSECEKRKLVEYRKKSHRMRKKCLVMTTGNICSKTWKQKIMA